MLGLQAMASMVTSASANAPDDGKAFEERWDGDDLVRFRVDGFLTEHQLFMGGEGGDQMERGLSRSAVMASARGLAIDGDKGTRRPAEDRSPNS